MSVYDEILNNSDIRTILEYYGLKIIKDKCNCPFHHDTHPSMSVHPNKGIAKCFSCGAGGNSISFIQKYENEVNHNNISVKDAMKKAIEIQSLNIVITDNNIKLTDEQKKQLHLNNILEDAITITEKNLRMNNLDSKKCLEYLKSRNLSDEIISQFHIGYDLSENNVFNELQKKYKVEELIELGIAKNYNNRIFDVFSNRITIPIIDKDGNPVGFGARGIDDSQKPKYLNTNSTTLFNKSTILFNYHKAKSYARNDELIVVEGYMDVISAKAMKMDNVVGTMGTAITKEHIDLIKKLECEVTLCLDNDEAGKEAMVRAIPDLLKEKLTVNVLNLSKLGSYKDFGDLQLANMTREQIYQTKVTAFTFLLQYKYIKDSQLNVENIHNIYVKMCKDGLIKDTKNTLNFKEFIMNNTNYTSIEIDDIINPTVIDTNNRIVRYKNTFFYYYILGLIKNYATKQQDNILLKYVESGKLTEKVLNESLNNEKYLKDNELKIDIGSYIKNFIFRSDDYISFKNDKKFIFENLLNNVKSFNSNGKIIDVELTPEQKELVIKQYSESFDNAIKDYIENNPDEFEEIFIANNNAQFEKLFPESYVENIKEQSINKFKNNGVMEAIRYALAYTDNMKSAMSRQVVNNNKYKTLLVFNNNKNILGLNTENIKSIPKEKLQYNKILANVNELEQYVNPEKQQSQTHTPMSIFIKLSGKEKETSKGMYLPINEETQVYIPKQLYKKSQDNQVEILEEQSSQAIMSEYKINPEKQTKKWSSKLSLEDFCKKYFKMYEVRFEKEVMA